MRPRIASLGLVLLAGCATGMSESAAPAEAPAAVQTTELTSASVTSSGLDPRLVRSRVESRMPELAARCGELETASDRYTTTLHLEIAPSGGVDLADARGSITGLDACIAEVARSWTFDPTNVRTITDVPIVLERQ